MSTSSTLSVAPTRTSALLPVLMYRIIAWTNARRLTGMRWFASSTIAMLPLYLIAIALRDHCGAGAHRGHRFQGVADQHVRRCDRHHIPGPHDLVNGNQQAAANFPAGMEFGEIFFFESARLEQNHRQGIAQREHCSRA